MNLEDATSKLLNVAGIKCRIKIELPWESAVVCHLWSNGLQYEIMWIMKALFFLDRLHIWSSRATLCYSPPPGASSVLAQSRRRSHKSCRSVEETAWRVCCTERLIRRCTCSGSGAASWEFDYRSSVMRRIMAFYRSAAHKASEVTSVHELQSCCSFWWQTCAS